MNFRTKIFLSLLMISIAFSIAIFITTYFIVKKEATTEFFLRYNSLGNVISNTFHQMGVISDQVNNNAVTILKKIDQFSGVPSNKNLAILANELGIQGFYVINKNGKFTRSSDLPLSMQKNSLFSYCAGYRNLVHGNLNKAVTPIIPSFPYGIPSKFIMIPNYNRSLILEAGTHLSYIGEILHKVIQYNKNIISIGLFSPNGYTLGFISNSGKFTQGKNKISISSLMNNYVKNKIIFLNFKIPASVGYCCECKIKHVQNITSDHYYYILQIKVSLFPLEKTLSDIRYDFLFLFLMMLIINFFISKFLANKLVDRINKMNQVIDDILCTGNLKGKVDTGKIHDEISGLANNFNKMIFDLDRLKEKEIEYEKTKGIEKISKQVAHDIRSPLSSLEILIKRLNGVEESKYIMLRNAVQHIRDITNNLEKSNYPGKNSVKDFRKIPSTQIAILLDYVISDRRVAFSNKNIEITHDFSPESYGYFIQVAPSEMKRIIINVINNACEALSPDKNKVSISLEQKENNVVIMVCDNGAGISEEAITSLFKRGFTTKKTGSGLGLSHAKETLEQWGGSINLIPNKISGVSVFITLPLQPTPSWFVNQLTFKNNSSVICVDDSIFIFNSWNERLKSVAAGKINVYYCQSKEELLSEVEKHRNESCTFLIDYEFSGKNYNGIDLIKIMLDQKIDASKVYLVTSRSYEESIQGFCVEHGIKMIPKHFVFKINLNINSMD